MTNFKVFGQWLRYISAAEPDSPRWKHPTVRKMLDKMAAYGKAHLLAGISSLSLQPVTVTDDGVTRVVTMLRTASYGFNRRDRTFFAALREEDGYWCEVPHDNGFFVIFDTFLPFRHWRQRVFYTLRTDFRDLLLGLVVHVGNDLSDDRRQRLWVMIETIVDRAWNGLHMRRRLAATFKTKRTRQQIRDLLCIDPEVLELARAARIRGRSNAIDQRWLTFVWQNLEALGRIRKQTPALLRPVAQHMYQYGVVPGRDPTRECKTWLSGRGISKRSYLLLAQLSDRPFREVLRRFHVHEAMEALALALWLTESGHAANAPLPGFYRATFDQFGSTMTAAKIRERLERVPKRVFNEAQVRMADALDHDAWREVALEYRGILDWWQDCNPQQHANAGWERWRVLAEEEAARERVAMDRITWPSAIEELRTPEAEVLALCTPLALHEEGRLLRHCVYNYVGMCRDDKVRLFSARMWHQGQIERATIGLSCGQHGWRIWDIRGYCNRRMGGHWVSLARQVAAAYQRKGASPQLPLPMNCRLGE